MAERYKSQRLGGSFDLVALPKLGVRIELESKRMNPGEPAKHRPLPAFFNGFEGGPNTVVGQETRSGGSKRGLDTPILMAKDSFERPTALLLLQVNDRSISSDYKLGERIIAIQHLRQITSCAVPIAKGHSPQLFPARDWEIA